MKRCPDSLLPNPDRWSALKEDYETFTYHYKRLLREIKKDVRRGLRKPVIGRRKIAGISTHQKDFLVQLKTRNFK